MFVAGGDLFDCSIRFSTSDSDTCILERRSKHSLHRLKKILALREVIWQAELVEWMRGPNAAVSGS